MQSNIHNISKIFCIILIYFSFSCNHKTGIDNQITLKLNLIESKTKKLRVNTFDTIEIRIKKFGFPTSRFVKIGECVTDSSGSVKIKIDREEEYTFLLGRKGYFASETFASSTLNNGQSVNVEVYSIDC